MSSLYIRFKISVNTNIWYLDFIEIYRRHISGYFDKNIHDAKIIQNLQKYLKKLDK